MRKLTLLMFVAILTVVSLNAQENEGNQTSKGKYLIEANTGFGGAEFGHTANTRFSLYSVDDMTIWSVGAEGGYFIMDDLAIKVGLGYTDYDGDSSSFSYKIGGKYYIGGNFPFQVDLTGASWKDADENPLWLGLQGGYAIFLNDNVSIEPGLRYNLSLNEDFTDEGIFEFQVGFALHF